MRTPSTPSLIAPAVLLALFAAGSLAGTVLALPVPAPLVGLALVMLGLRIGVMAAAVQEPPAAAGTLAACADVGEPALRVSNG